jgi:hypothetical protein
MSSALALVLMAGMAVPGDGPEKVSGEVVEPRPLAGNKLWQQRVAWRGRRASGEFYHLVEGGKLFLASVVPQRVRYLVVDEGQGRLSLQDVTGQIIYHGIYSRGTDDIIISFCDAKYKRPTSFREVGEREHRLYLFHKTPRPNLPFVLP